MKISINDEPINFSLENEKRLGEVLDGINEWLNKAGFVMTDFSADGKALSFSDGSSWRSQPIDDVGRIDVNAMLPVDLRLRHYTVLEQYFTLLRNSVRESNERSRTEISAELPSVLETMRALLGKEPDVSVYESLVTFIEESGAASDGPLEPAIREKYAGLLDGICALLSERIEEIGNPREKVRKTVAFLVSMIPELNDVSVLLQTGRDRDAMMSIVRFTEASQKLLRVFSILISSEPAGSEKDDRSSFDPVGFYREFNGILHELLEAFESRDSVLIGDLLEYEITPRLEKLRTLIPDRDRGSDE